MSDLAELFARDPMELSAQDIAAIVEHLRASRAHFALNNKPVVEKSAKKTKKTAASSKPMTLEDLDI